MSERTGTKGRVHMTELKTRGCLKMRLPLHRFSTDERKIILQQPYEL